MKATSISSFQMSVLLMAFLTGSSIIMIPTPITGAAHNGAWLSVLLAMCSGLLILACILYLHRQYPGLTYVDYGKKMLGKWFGTLLLLPLLIIVPIQLSNIVIDIGGFFNSTMMKETPSVVIHFMFFVLASLTARAGIEVMARMFVLLLFTTLLFVAIVWFLAAPYYRPEYLLPLLPDGIKPVLHGAYITNGFPFAESGLFAMLLPYVRATERPLLGKYMTRALIASAITLAISVIVTILATGPLAGFYKFSLYQLARIISFQQIVERVESIIGFSLIIGSYMKATISLFILNEVVSRLFHISNKKMLVFPLALTCFFLSVTMYSTEFEFNEAVMIIWPMAINCLFILPLMLITAISLIKRN